MQPITKSVHLLTSHIPREECKKVKYKVILENSFVRCQCHGETQLIKAQSAYLADSHQRTTFYKKRVPFSMRVMLRGEMLCGEGQRQVPVMVSDSIFLLTLPRGHLAYYSAVIFNFSFLSLFSQACVTEFVCFD